MLNIDDAIFVNQIAQGIVSTSKASAWFEAKSLFEQREILLGLNFLILQASPRDGDAESAVSESMLRPNLNPCILLVKPNLKVQLAKLAQLPSPELPQVFLLLLKLLAIADRRRREQKPLDLVNHWWHRDLSDPVVVEQIRREHR